MFNRKLKNRVIDLTLRVDSLDDSRSCFRSDIQHLLSMIRDLRDARERDAQGYDGVSTAEKLRLLMEHLGVELQSQPFTVKVVKLSQPKHKPNK